MKTALTFLCAACLILQGPRIAGARGFGGSHSEGGGSRGNSSSGGERSGSGSSSRGSEGQRGGNSSSGGERSSNDGGSRSSEDQRGGSSGSEGQRSGNYSGDPNSAEAGAYHHSQGGAYNQNATSVNSYHATQYNSMPTDAGYGASTAGGHGYAASHATQPTNANSDAAAGAAVRNSNPGAGTFNKNWYGAHPNAWHASGWAAGDEYHSATWATAAPAAGMAAAVQPVSYDYGNSVTYQGNQVYMGGQPAATSDQYYQQASNIAQSMPPADPQSSGWTPLGVYGLLHNQETSPHYLMQLALHKSGAVAGNYTDLVDNTVQPIQGSVDKQSQRVAWTVGDNKNTVGEAGLYNLTQDEAPALIHIGRDRTQQWRLVRLKQAEAAAEQQ